jgi:hypothetical protein
MVSKRVLVWASVESDIRRLVEKLAASKGVSISEYVRQLILSDLDRRSVFTSKLKAVSGEEKKNL